MALANGDAPGAVAAYRRAIDLMATGESAPPDILRKMARQQSSPVRASSLPKATYPMRPGVVTLPKSS